LVLYRAGAGDSAVFAADTLGAGTQRVSTAPILDRAGRPMAEVVKRLVQPLFEERPLVTGNAMWDAVYSPGPRRIELSYAPLDGESGRFEVRWPAEPAIVLTDSAALAAAWAFHQVAMRNNAGVDRLWRSTGAAQRNKILELSRDLLTFSDSLAAVAAMFAGRNCLWISGVRPGEYVDGTGLVLLGIDVTTRRLGGVIRVGAPGTRIRDVDDDHAYTTRRDQNGEFILERAPLPPDCAAGVR
jgi:hypothetical protein